ncbi:MAG TPA: acyl-CoA dehydrogenase family protein [Amycolatopsis sp.]|uniref:acyl-CoA dehydrogenase family protein n=1 Tax=Amycolatopsis sp. TaxID=37632 RepID=UPI002B4858E1|nr:acyl-CoA dehydrogenase family protein [Amycolatopsis sp.]HKS47024.1 acyl-CoA dehydrogenase family protein [Amycolatopsis sp.]
MASGELALLARTGEELLNLARNRAEGDAATESAAGWRLLAEQGMARVSLPGPAGAGEPLRFLGALLRAAGRAAFSVPLIDTHVGVTLLNAAGFHHGDSEDSACAVGLDPRLLCPSAPAPARLAVVHPEIAETVVLAVPDGDAARIDAWRRADLSIDPARNIAGDPVAVLELGALPHPPWSAKVELGVAGHAALVDVLGRSAMMAGAAERVLEQTLRYVGEREQFGRALAAFQSVQQTAATMASTVVAASVAADAALLALESAAVSDGGPGRADADVAVLAARLQCSRTAAFVSRAAHQLHGAIGFTDEHSLGLATTRLTAWRAHGPSHTAVAAQLGRRVFGSGDVWSLVVGPGT